MADDERLSGERIGREGGEQKRDLGDILHGREFAVDRLAEFVDRHRDAMLGPRTVVVIVSDGLDRGDTAVLARAMRAIRSRARRVIGLFPQFAGILHESGAAKMRRAAAKLAR